MVLEVGIRELRCRETLGRDLDFRSRHGWKLWGAALGRDLNFTLRPGWARLQPGKSSSLRVRTN